MKTSLLFLFIVMTWLFSPADTKAQPCTVATDITGAGVTYGLRITDVNPVVVYEAYLVASGNGCRSIGSSQFSLVVSPSTTITLGSGNPSGVFNTPWSFNTIATDGISQFYAAATAGSGKLITLTAGQQLPLFTFTLSTPCNGGVRIFRNITDNTGIADPANVQGGDFGNNFALAAAPAAGGNPFLPGREAYVNNESSFRDCPATILPLTLSNFSARAVSNKQVLLTWQTLNEVNTKQFTVERSEKPSDVNNTNWQIIGILAAAGTVSGSRNYQLTDNQPLNGINFYRLRTTDKDGRELLSEIRQVNFKRNGLLLSSVYPNPVERGGAVTIAVAETIHYRMLDKTGRLINAGTFAPGTGKLKAPNVAGTYLLEISGSQNDSNKEHHRIIVQ